MPRIPPSLFREARRISPHLPTLLPATRDLPSAINELRWIRQHVHEAEAEASLRNQTQYPPIQILAQTRSRVATLCARRGRGVPLQYVLGTQPFGPLDLKCRPGVLVPRPETEAWVLQFAAYLARRSKSKSTSTSSLGKKGLRIVDFCTGTGCVALGLFASLGASSRGQLHVRGVDVSPRAVRLARSNFRANVSRGNMRPPDAPRQSLEFVQADVFDDGAVQKLIVQEEGGGEGEEIGAELQPWDVLVANPPYVSRDVWSHGRGQLGFSVRKYEPRLALVPGEDVPVYEGCTHEDVFYARLLDVAVSIKARVVMFELGDEAQARRVLELVARQAETCGGAAAPPRCEVWRDWPEMQPGDDELPVMRVKHGQETRDVPVVGSGNVRCVLIEMPG